MHTVGREIWAVLYIYLFFSFSFLVAFAKSVCLSLCLFFWGLASWEKLFSLFEGKCYVDKEKTPIQAAGMAKREKNDYHYLDRAGRVVVFGLGMEHIRLRQHVSWKLEVVPHPFLPEWSGWTDSYLRPAGLHALQQTASQHPTGQDSTLLQQTAGHILQD